MVNNEKTNNTTETTTETAAEKVQANLKGSKDDDILKLARRQKAEFDQERVEWEAQEKKRAKDEMELLRENTHLKKEMGDIRKEIEAIKYQSTLDREMELASETEKKTGEPVKMSKEERVQQIFAEVIKERKEKALKEREKKNDNVFYC